MCPRSVVAIKNFKNKAINSDVNEHMTLFLKYLIKYKSTSQLGFFHTVKPALKQVSYPETFPVYSLNIATVKSTSIQSSQIIVCHCFVFKWLNNVNESPVDYSHEFILRFPHIVHQFVF